MTKTSLQRTNELAGWQAGRQRKSRRVGRNNKKYKNNIIHVSLAADVVSNCCGNNGSQSEISLSSAKDIVQAAMDGM